VQYHLSYKKVGESVSSNSRYEYDWGNAMKRRIFFQTIGLGSFAALSLSNKKGLMAGERETREQKGSMDPWIEVSLDHIGWNLAQIKKKVKVPVMAVVKANAYGHGLVGVSQYLEKIGIDGLMVGKLEEAVMLREAGIKCPVLNFGPFSKEDCEGIIKRNVTQSIYTEEARYLDEVASRLKSQAAVDIHLDTGMNRVGAPYDQALPLIEKFGALSHLKIRGISTTLTEDKEFDREQLQRFLDVCYLAKQKGIALGLKHAASSAGIFADPRFYLDMVRPGIAIYGYYPDAETQKEDSLALKPALKLRGKVVFVKEMQPGESLSYHRAIKATQKMRVATVGIGYSDGYPSQLAGKGSVLIKNKKYPVIAAVTANHAMVDLEGEPEIKIGDEVTLIDNQKNSGLTADVLEEASGVSTYKILIGLNPLLPRKYSAS
jgi:alanine racemase